MKALELAKKFHEIYEKRAPEFDYETCRETKEFDPETSNGKLMIAVCGEIIEYMEAGDFWANLVYPEGAKPQEIEAELTDYHTIMREVAEVYDYVTCGRVSKPNTNAAAVIDEFNEQWVRKDEPEDDIYTDEDGLIYCSFCGTVIDAADKTEDKK